MKIVFTTRLPKEAFVELQKHELIMPELGQFQEAELKPHLQDADVLVPTFNYTISSDILANAHNLKYIAGYGAGYNNIPVGYCQKHNILVTNTPTGATEPTAEHTVTLLCAIAHRIAELDRKLRQTSDIRFGVMENLGRGLYGKTLGIVGMGSIGKAVARRCKALGMSIIYHNRHRLPLEVEQAFEARYCPTLDELLERCDVVTLHLPYSADVQHLIGKRQIDKMKTGAILINTARGGIVDETALIEALKTGKLFGAALDVYENEPDINPELKKLDNVLLSPHIGTGSLEGRIVMGQEVTRNILAFEKGKYEEMDLINNI